MNRYMRERDVCAYLYIRYIIQKIGFWRSKEDNQLSWTVTLRYRAALQPGTALLVEQTWAFFGSWRGLPAILSLREAIKDKWWPRRQAHAASVTSWPRGCGRVSETGSLGAPSGSGEVVAVGQPLLFHSIAVFTQELPKK